MNHLYRNFFLLALLVSLVQTGHTQLIEKAPSSPVAVTATLDSLNALVEISDIYIRGYKRTKPYIIQREVPFKKGEHLLISELLAKLNLCKQQIINTSLFVDVDIKPFKLDSNHILIDIYVKERWYFFPIPYFNIVTRNFNDWWVNQNHRLDRVNYGVKFTQYNFTGRNDNLNLWFISGFTQQVSLRYDNPFLDKQLKHGLNVGVGFSRNRELNYGLDSNIQKFLKTEDQFILNQTNIDVAYTYRPAIKTRHAFKAVYHTMSINDTVLAYNPKYLPGNGTKARYFDMSYGIQYFNVDYIPYPLTGFMGSAEIFKRFGRDNNIWQLSATANYSKKLFPNTFVQLQASGIIKLPFTQSFINSNLLGSASLYMRGLEYYVVNGVAGGVARATLKNEILSLNVRNPIKSKTHDKIPFRVFVKAYGDLGYAYSRDYGNSIFNNQLLRTWGAGIDIITFYDIVLRFEYSFNQIGQNGLYFHNQNDW